MSCLLGQFKKYDFHTEARIMPIQRSLSILNRALNPIWDPLMISGTIKASQMKLCTVTVLLKAYQKTKGNFRKFDL